MNLKPKSHVKSKFSSEEDTLLTQLVQQFGNENWALIASKIKGRSTRQCRERYINYLCPSLNHSPWTEEEDKLLIEKYKEYGSKWKAITDFFPNRTDINVKNRWLKLERHRIKSYKHKPIVIPPSAPKDNPKPKVDPKPPNIEPQQNPFLKKGYAGDVWIRFAEPIYKCYESADFLSINEDVIKFFKIL